MEGIILLMIPDDVLILLCAISVAGLLQINLKLWVNSWGMQGESVVSVSERDCGLDRCLMVEKSYWHIKDCC